jgi:hypothetical protein
MRQLDGYKESERLVGQVAARAAIAKAYRCYYVAESYAAAEKWREAMVRRPPPSPVPHLPSALVLFSSSSCLFDRGTLPTADSPSPPQHDIQVLFDRATLLMVEANDLYDDDSAADAGPASLDRSADRGGFGPGEDRAAIEKLDAVCTRREGGRASGGGRGGRVITRGGFVPGRGQGGA